MTEHIQNKTTLLNSFFNLIISHLSPPQHRVRVCAWRSCVCVLHLTDTVTNVTSQNHYSKSPICYPLRDLSTHTYMHTHTKPPWQLGVSAGSAIVPVESSREGYHVSPLSLCSVSTHISSLFIVGLSAPLLARHLKLLLCLKTPCTRDAWVTSNRQ